MNVNHNIDQIRAFATKMRLSRFSFAEKAGLSRNALRDFDKQEWNPRVETVRKIEKFIEKTLRDLAT